MLLSTAPVTPAPGAPTSLKTTLRLVTRFGRLVAAPIPRSITKRRPTEVAMSALAASQSPATLGPMLAGMTSLPVAPPSAVVTEATGKSLGLLVEALSVPAVPAHPSTTLSAADATPSRLTYSSSHQTADANWKTSSTSSGYDGVRKRVRDSATDADAAAGISNDVARTDTSHTPSAAWLPRADVTGRAVGQWGSGSMAGRRGPAVREGRGWNDAVDSSIRAEAAAGTYPLSGAESGGSRYRRPAAEEQLSAQTKLFEELKAMRGQVGLVRVQPGKGKLNNRE